MRLERNQEWIDRMKNSKRLKLTTMQAFTHYQIVFFFLFIVLLTAWNLFEIYVTDTYSGVRTGEELLIVALPFLLLAGLFAFVQHRRLRFKEIDAALTEEQFQEVVQRTAKDLSWRIDKNNNTFFRAHRSWNWTGSWGEMVTIIKYKNHLLINSICDPDYVSSIISYGQNKKNIDVFKKNLTDVLNNTPIEVKIEKVNNEWSIKRMIIRLFAYPFCAFLIVFGAYMLVEPSTFNAMISGLVAMVVAGVYLYLDMKILATKTKDK